MTLEDETAVATLKKTFLLRIVKNRQDKQWCIYYLNLFYNYYLRTLRYHKENTKLLMLSTTLAL